MKIKDWVGDKYYYIKRVYKMFNAQHIILYEDDVPVFKLVDKLQQ